MKKKRELTGLQRKRCKSSKISSMKIILSQNRSQSKKKTLKRNPSKELTKKKVMNFEST